jgi:hypothetical protein
MLAAIYALPEGPLRLAPRIIKRQSNIPEQMVVEIAQVAALAGAVDPQGKRCENAFEKGGHGRILFAQFVPATWADGGAEATRNASPAAEANSFGARPLAA